MTTHEKPSGLPDGNLLTGDVAVSGCSFGDDVQLHCSGEIINSSLGKVSQPSNFQGAVDVHIEDSSIDSVQVASDATAEGSGITLDLKNSNASGVTVHDGVKLTLHNSNVESLTLHSGATYSGFGGDAHKVTLMDSSSLSTFGDVQLDSCKVSPKSEFTLSGNFSILRATLVGEGSFKIDDPADYFRAGDSVFGGGVKPATVGTSGEVWYVPSAFLSMSDEELRVGTAGKRIDDLLSSNIAQTLIRSASLLATGAHIQEFCIVPSVHLEDGCRCGLYYPLLIGGDPLAIVYFLWQAGLRSAIPTAYRFLSVRQIEDGLRRLVTERTERTFGGTYMLTGDYVTAISWDRARLSPESVRSRITEFCGLEDFSSFGDVELSKERFWASLEMDS